jgi:hypothetical protein
MKATLTTLILPIIIFFNTNLKAINPTIPNGIIYQLALQSIDIKESRTIINEYHYLRKVMIDGKYKYQFGKYTSFKEVDSLKTVLTDIGCSEIEILAYNNHLEIPLTEAISIQYKEDYLDDFISGKKVAKTITTKEVNYLLDVQKSGLEHYYSLAIPVTSIETVDRILEQVDNEQVLEISVDNNLYSIGKYESFTEVIAARKQYIENEIYDVFIMAQITDKRIDDEDTNNLAISIQSLVNELADK